MTSVVIDDIIPRTQLLATAGQTVFNTNWTSDAATDVDVYARAVGVPPDDITQLVSPTLYNVTFVGGSQTVRVTFLSGRVLNDVITIVRNTPAERLNLYINTNFVPSMLNQDFGILTLVDQQAQMYDTVVTPHYNLSATIEPIVDEILPILEANQIWAMNSTRTAIIEYDVPASGGLAPKTAKYLIQTATSELPNAQAMGALASGFVVNTTTTGVQSTRIITGTANQITLTNGDGQSGNPTVSIATNPILPGTGSMIPPIGNTAQRPGSPVDGMVRYNTDLSALEVYESTVWDALSGGVVDSVTGTTNRITIDNTDPANPIVDIASNYVGQTSITTLGTIATGVWQGTILGGTYGGTGVNNGASTITIGGNLSMIGAFTFAGTLTGNTAVTFPTSGTLATTTGTVTSIIGTANQIAASAPAGDVTLSIVSNPILPGTGGVTLPQGNTAARAGGAGTIRFNTQSLVFESTIDGAAWATIDTSASGDVDSIIGTANQVIASNPTGNVTLSLPQSIATTSSPTFAALTLTAPLTLANGGSSANLTANNGGIIYSTATAMEVLAGTATAGQILRSGATAAPSWSTSTYPATNAVNTLLYASSANVMSALATANDGVLITSAAGVPSISSTLPAAVLTNIPGRLKSFQVFTSGTAQTYTRPAGITSILVEVLGGGGGGGGSAGAASSVAGAAGGGAGGYARLWVASASSTYTYTVGAGGAGGTAGNNAGSTGGTTTFNASSLQATGGGGGSGCPSTASTLATGVAGGVGGVGTNGIVNSGGASGLPGFVALGNGISGSGAAGHYGGGGLGLGTTQSAGNAATSYGSGGGGAFSIATSQAGGAGSAGLIVVWELS